MNHSTTQHTPGLNVRMLVQFIMILGGLFLVSVLILNHGAALTKPIGGTALLQKPPTSSDSNTNREQRVELAAPLAAELSPPPAKEKKAEEDKSSENKPAKETESKATTVELDYEKLPVTRKDTELLLRTNSQFAVKAVFDPGVDFREWISSMRLVTFAMSKGSNQVAKLERTEGGGYRWKRHRAHVTDPLCVSVLPEWVPSMAQADLVVEGSAIPMIGLTWDLEQALFRQLDAVLAKTQLSVTGELTAIGRLYEVNSRPAFTLTELRVTGKPPIKIVGSGRGGVWKEDGR